LLYFFGGFENGLNVVLIQYPADIRFVVPFMYERMEKFLLPISSCDGCVLGFIVLHAESHHPTQKQSAINSLVHRAFIISDKEHLQMELNHLKQALQENGYDKKDINKIINKHTSKTMNPNTQLS